MVMPLWISFLAYLFNVSPESLKNTTPTVKQEDTIIANKTSATSAEAYAPVAVVELFTSQGCSSCPPADALLGDIIAKTKATGTQVFALSFHVDYWNYLGWKDPYSQAQFSSRQRRYGQRFGSVYTPQMVVNGQTAFVGSSKYKSELAIDAALETPSAAKIRLSAPKFVGEQRVKIPYGLDGDYEGCTLHVALVERDLNVQVKRGENHGRYLEHDNVVRKFQTFENNYAQTGGFVLDAPKDLNWDNASVIVYLQDEKTWRIIGASAVELKKH